MELLRRQFMTLHFPPPYSSESKHIAKLWNLVKDIWMAPKYRHAQTLENNVVNIVDKLIMWHYIVLSEKIDLDLTMI